MSINPRSPEYQADILAKRIEAREQVKVRAGEAREVIQRWNKLHCATVEFQLGDSAAHELGRETVVTDQVTLDQCNAVGSYIVDTTRTKKREAHDPEPVIDKTRGKHRVLLDLDIPHVYVPSSTPGHGHLMIDVQIDYWQLVSLLKTLAWYGIVQHGFADATISRGETWLRAPGVEKDINTAGI